jgi:hypothetical protein
MRSRIRSIRFAALLLSCGLLFVLAACARTAPEQALRNTIADMQSAVEARDAGALEEHLAEDFIGPDGMDRRQAGQLARVMFLRNRDIGATTGPLQVSLRDDEHATVRFTVALTGGSGVLLPDSAQVYEVDTGWRMRGDAWELVSADWKPRM